MKLNRLQLRAARGYAKKCGQHATPIIAYDAGIRVFSERDVNKILLATVDGYERVAALLKAWRKQPPLNPTQTKKQLLYDLLARVEQALVSVSDYCRAYHLQDCSNCDDLKCCDNTYRQYHPRKR
jgi:hypothetical protein